MMWMIGKNKLVIYLKNSKCTQWSNDTMIWMIQWSEWSNEPNDLNDTVIQMIQWYEWFNELNDWMIQWFKWYEW